MAINKPKKGMTGNFVVGEPGLVVVSIVGNVRVSHQRRRGREIFPKPFSDQFLDSIRIKGLLIHMTTKLCGEIKPVNAQVVFKFLARQMGVKPEKVKSNRTIYLQINGSRLRQR